MSKQPDRKTRKAHFNYQKLEPKRCLASVGWDGPGQGSAELTYHLGEAPAEIGQATFERVIEQALEVWSDVADITFTQTDVARQSDSLDISFGSIDGGGGILAQAYFPDDVNRSQVAGDIKFDSADNWEVGNTQGFRATDLLYVAVHEIGHALGLDHSDAAGSVLNSTVSPNQTFTALDSDDIDSALALYAPASTVVIPETVTPVVPAQPETPATPVDESVVPETEAPADTDTDSSEDGDNTPTETDRERRRNHRNWANRFFQRRFRIFNNFANRFFGSDFGSNDGAANESNSQTSQQRTYRIHFFRR